MLQAQNLKFSYDGSRTLSFPNIACKDGEHWLLLGQSGSGKTTLLHLLGGLLSPQSGSIKVGETEMSRLNGSSLDKFRGQNIGIIFQTAHFIKSLTVQENLILAQQLSGEKTDKQLIVNILQKLNLEHKLKSKTSELSVGEQQRVAIARALVNSPALILADEPTSALDDKNTNEVIRLLEKTASEANATLIIVTHDNRLKEYFKNQIHLQPQLTI